MEEKKEAKSCGGGLAVFFLIGFVGALAFGWMVFPELLFSKQTQPIRFSHVAHVQKASMECTQCHSYAANGQFLGLPTTQVCADCHADDSQATNEADKKELQKFVTEYADAGKQVPWLVYQKQPDNVFFSHSAHTGFECTKCHPDVAKMDTPPVFRENRISGYSKQTMRMWQCERCHAEFGTSNACYVCHK